MNLTAMNLEAKDAPAFGRHAVRFIVARPVTLIIAALAILLAALPMNASFLQLTPESIERGLWWTVVTGHLLHVGAEHLLLDALGLLIVGCVFEPMFGRRWLAISLIAGITISLSVFSMYPELREFRGLSAMDHAMFAAGAVVLAQRHDWRPALVILGVLAVKCLTELLSGDSAAGQFLDEAAFGVPVPWMHAIGALSGGMAAVAMSLIPCPASPANRALS